MTLKTACKTAMFVTVVSIPLTLFGYALVYIPILTEHYHLTNLVSAVVGLLTVLLQAGGFALFLLAVLPRFKDPDANTSTLVVIAGLLVLLGALIGVALSMMHIVPMYEHLTFTRFVFYMTMHIFTFLSGLCLGVFILTQTSGTSFAKGLAATALVTTLILCALIAIIYAIHFSEYFDSDSILRSLGSAAMMFGQLAKLAAILLFLISYLKQKPLPPEAGVIDPAPEPIPTLSAEQLRPEEE